MINKIYINQWLALKPYNTQTLTDTYYLKLSNDIKTVLINSDSFVLISHLAENEIDILSCFLTSYFEDIISQIDIWNTFINCHTKLYNKKLPFFNTDEYYENEINEQDISFLVWYFLNTIQDKKYLKPSSIHVKNIAQEVTMLFDEKYEYAPENKHLKSFYAIDNNETDYYVVRNFIDDILFNTYLFYPDTALKLQREMEKLINENDTHLSMYLRDVRDSSVHKNHTRLLSLKGNEWAAEILGSEHPVSADLLCMSQKINGFFLYKGQNQQDIFLEHIASGKKFDLTKKSFDHYHDLKKIDEIVFMGIVQWKNEWWFSGIQFQTKYNANIVLDEKNSIESRMAVNFLSEKDEDSLTILQKQKEAFLSFNNGSPIAFLPSTDLHRFFIDYIAFYNKSLNLSHDEKEQAEKRAKKEGYFGNKSYEEPNFAENYETGLVFFNPKSGGEVALGVNSAFPFKTNPFFVAEDSENDIMQLLISDDLSAELAMYCIDNFKNVVPFFKEGEGKKYIEDIDFLLRFWKTEKYHSNPSITFVGQREK
jgi:hypothetical protein